MNQSKIESIQPVQMTASEPQPIVNSSSPDLRKTAVSRRFIIIGVEYNNLWKPVELFVGENEHEILLTTDDFNDARKFENLEAAEYVIEYLAANYNDYSWHVLVSKNGG